MDTNELDEYVKTSNIKGLKDFYLSALDGECINCYQYIDFIGLWGKKLYNNNFNRVEFDAFKLESGNY